MKAFIVQEPNENTGGVFYAERAIEARRRGANEYNDGELGGMTCRRCPALDDKRGDLRAINRYLLEEGWRWDDGRIDLDKCPNAFVSIGGGVYENPMEWLAERERKAIERRRRRVAELEMWGRWPWAEDIRVHVEPSGKIDASIKLPFLEGTVRYLEREGRHYVERRDLDVFYAAYTVNRDSDHFL